MRIYATWDRGLGLDLETREIENELTHQEEGLRQVAAIKSQQICLCLCQSLTNLWVNYPPHHFLAVSLPGLRYTRQRVLSPRMFF